MILYVDESSQEIIDMFHPNGLRECQAHGKIQGKETCPIESKSLLEELPWERSPQESKSLLEEFSDERSLLKQISKKASPRKSNP